MWPIRFEPRSCCNSTKVPSNAITGLDINEYGIKNANELARRQKIDALVHFQRADASRKLPIAANSFDAVLYGAIRRLWAPVH